MKSWFLDRAVLGCCIASSQCVCRPLIRPGNLRLIRSVPGCESWFQFRSAVQAGSRRWHYLVQRIPSHRDVGAIAHMADKVDDMLIIRQIVELSGKSICPRDKSKMKTPTRSDIALHRGIARRRLACRGLVVGDLDRRAAANQAANIPAPSPDKLERITEFFNNEVATGKLPGAVVLIQQHGKPVYLKSFGVQDCRDQNSDDIGHDLCASFDDKTDHQCRGDDADRRRQALARRSRVQIHSGVCRRESGRRL